MRLSTLFGAAALLGLVASSAPAMAQTSRPMHHNGMMHSRGTMMHHRGMMQHHRGMMMHHRRMMEHHRMKMMHRRAM